MAKEQEANKLSGHTVTVQTSNQHFEAARLHGLIAPTVSSPAFPADQDAEHSEAARLQSLITKLSSPEAPYKALICPMNSDFTSAWRAFRHAFRDLTLLTWEERFDANRAIQKARAQQLNIEPFLYSKPAMGLPMGLLPQESGYLQGTATGLHVMGESDDGYVRNAFNLPSIDHALSRNGAIGSAIHREREEKKKLEEEVRRRAEEKEDMERKKRGDFRGKRPNYNKPMFNGVTGRPNANGFGGYASSANGGDLYAGFIKKRRMFPNERDE